MVGGGGGADVADGCRGRAASEGRRRRVGQKSAAEATATAEAEMKAAEARVVTRGRASVASLRRIRVCVHVCALASYLA